MLNNKRKSRTTHAEFAAAAAAAKDHINFEQATALVHSAAERVRDMLVRYKRPAYCWSGGKDSAVLRIVCDLAGVETCMIGLCELEFPAFLEWLDINEPPRLDRYNTGQDLEWLQAHSTMLFPEDSVQAGRWFRLVQNTAQERYAERARRDLLLFGRREADGNRCGERGLLHHSSGVPRYSPLWDWSHDQILAVNAWFELPRAPFYDWPRGYRVGTGPWPKRRVPTHAQGWAETFAIDPVLTREVAPHFDSGRAFLNAQDRA
jgi:3'-phosphoadenosine 5'-phosphosulfate sulfotransferase (PAPS reductase)/FAD synthetase